MLFSCLERSGLFLCPFLRKEVSAVANRIMGITVEIGGDTTKLQTAKVVYVRNRNKRKEYLCLISTDVNLDENEIIRVYGKRWDIEVFFKVCKSYLTAKSMKYTNKARNKVFRFVHLSEHAKHDTSDSRKETVQ